MYRFGWKFVGLGDIGYLLRLVWVIGAPLFIGGIAIGPPCRDLSSTRELPDGPRSCGGQHRGGGSIACSARLLVARGRGVVAAGSSKLAKIWAAQASRPSRNLPFTSSSRATCFQTSLNRHTKQPARWYPGIPRVFEIAVSVRLSRCRAPGARLAARQRRCPQGS